MNVKNMTNDNGNVTPNQFIIKDNILSDKKYFQSYDSIIVLIDNGITYLDSVYWNYSKTTSKYRNVFLNENTEKTKEKIKNGTYILKNLN